MHKLAALIFLLFTSPVFAQDTLLTLDDIYDPEKRINFSGKMATGLTWLPDGTSYLERRNGQVTKVDAATGKAEPFYDAAKMEAAFAKLAGVSTADAKRMASSPGRINTKLNAVVINFGNDLFYNSSDKF